MDGERALRMADLNQTTLWLRELHVGGTRWWVKPRKNSEIRNDAPSSRQPLVKGERLVRSELGAAMTGTA